MEITQNKYENWISNHKFTAWMNSFINSEWLIALNCLIILISSCFAAEIVCFTLVAILALLTLLFSKDTKALMFMILTLNMGMSYKNGISYNPNPDQPTIYDNQGVLIYFYILAAIVILSLIFNLLMFKQYKNKLNHFLYLFPGLVALSISYLLSGCIGNFTFKNLVYSASNCFMILGLYFYFSLTAFTYCEDSSTYICKVMLYTSLLISLQLIHIYLTNSVIYHNVTINKENIVNGWGISNNFAGYLNLCFPFIAFLIIKNKKNIKYFICLLINIIFVILTISRASYLILAVELIAFTIIYFVMFKEKRKKILIILSSLLMFLIILFIIFHKEIIKFFEEMLKLGFDMNGRKDLYEVAWKSFIQFPVFGKGWFLFERDGYVPPTLFAPSFKAHNFLLQLLGSTGVFGLICFLFLIVSIFYFSLKNKTKEKIIFLIGVITLLSTSILDNYFFDYGFERYFAIFLVGIVFELKKDKKITKEINSKEDIVNE